jgi:hypothetical protein
MNVTGTMHTFNGGGIYRELSSLLGDLDMTSAFGTGLREAYNTAMGRVSNMQ